MQISNPDDRHPMTYRIGGEWFLAFGEHAIRLDRIHAMRSQFSETNQRWETVIYTDIPRHSDGSALVIATHYDLDEFLAAGMEEAA